MTDPAVLAQLTASVGKHICVDGEIADGTFGYELDATAVRVR